MVTGAYHPEISSSALQCRDMARLLDGRAEVRVLTTAVDRHLRRRDLVDDVQVSRVFVDVTSRPSKLMASARMVAALVRLLPWCDVVHIHGFSTKNVIVTGAARMFGRPVVLSLHTAEHDEAPNIRQHSPMAWWAFRRADLYLSVSPRLVDAYLAAGLPAERIRLVPNGIDMGRFTPATLAERIELRQRFGLALDQPVVLFVGFFSQDKQPRIAFDAWMELAHAHAVDATLLFVGATKSAYFEVDEDLATRMRADAAAAGRADRLHFAGMTQDVHDYMRAADVFVLTSRREGLPVALLEAMACGLPCVATRLPGATDTIIDERENGILVPVGDVAAFASALATVLRDRALAEKLGAAARETIARRFANRDVAEQWLLAYERAVAAHDVAGGKLTNKHS
jgi:glycosyltransferase involved in cell wall biosynthesis